MADLAKLVVSLEAQTAAYQKGLERAEKRTERWKKKVKRNLNAVQVSFGALALGAFTKKIVDATAKQEQAVQQLRQGLASTGGVVGFSLKELTDQAAEFQKVTAFGDEAIIEAQSQLVTFTSITGEQFKKTTELALDLSTRFGVDLKSSVLQLGKALNDPVANLSALSRAGIQFSKDQKDMIKGLVESGELMVAQNIILKELETQFGGSAKAAGETFGGALAGLKNDLGDLLEADGGLPAATASVQDLRDTIQDPAVQQGFEDLASGAISAFGGVAKIIARATTAAKALGINTAFEVQSAIAAGNAVKEALTLGDGIGFEEARERFRARIAELRKIRDDMLLDLNKPSPPDTAPDSGVVGGVNVTGSVLGSSAGVEGVGQPGSGDSAGAEGLGGLNPEGVTDPAEVFKLKLEQEEAQQQALFELREGWRQQELDAFSSHETGLSNFLFDTWEHRAGFQDDLNKEANQNLRASLGQALSVFGGHSKKMFKLNRAAAITNAVVSTYRGIAKALELPYPANLKAAATVAAKGFSTVSKIKSQKLGSGGSGTFSASGGFGGGFSGQAIPSGGTGADLSAVTNQQSDRDFNLTVVGALQPDLIREIMEKVGDQIGDGVNMNLEFA